MPGVEVQAEHGFDPKGVHHPRAAITAVGEAISEELAKLAPLSPDEQRRLRAERFYAIGKAT